MGRSIRILAGSLRPTAGSHIYNRDLIYHLRSRGHQVSVICFDAGPAEWTDVEVHELPLHPTHFGKFWRIGTALQAWNSSVQLRMLNLSTPDYVIAAEHLFIRPHAVRYPSTPWIYLPHSSHVGAEIDSYQMEGLQRFVAKQYYVNTQRWALSNADSVMRFNQFSADTLRAAYKLKSDASLWVNPVGINVPNQHKNNDSETSHRPIRFLSLGRLEVLKNVEFTLRSLAALSPKNWTLDVVGSGPQRESLEALCVSLGITERVQFHGHQSDPQKWYASADLLLFPTRLESMGLVLLEAMANGLPVLVIRNDGDRYRVPFDSIVADRVTGHLATNEQDFQRRLEEIIRAPDSLRNISTTAAQYVAETYSWEHHIDRLEDHFEMLDRRNYRSKKPVRVTAHQ